VKFPEGVVVLKLPGGFVKFPGAIVVVKFPGKGVVEFPGAGVVSLELGMFGATVVIDQVAALNVFPARSRSL